MSCYNVEIEKLDDSEEHWNYARGKVAQLKLVFKNKRAELEREKQIQLQEERERNYKGDDSAIRYDALHAAAHFNRNGWL